MGLSINNTAIASGRAKCYVCGVVIAAGEECVSVSGYRTAGHCHKTCPKENKEKLAIELVEEWFLNDSLLSVDDYNNILVKAGMRL